METNSDSNKATSSFKATSLKCLNGEIYKKREILYSYLNLLNLMFSTRIRDSEIFSQWKRSLNVIDKCLNFSFIEKNKHPFKAKVKDVDNIGRLVVIDS